MCHNFKYVCGRHFNGRVPFQQCPGEGDGRITDVSEENIYSLESNLNLLKREQQIMRVEMTYSTWDESK